jgi:hypothetical protein
MSFENTVGLCTAPPGGPCGRILLQATMLGGADGLARAVNVLNRLDGMSICTVRAAFVSRLRI